MVGTLEVFNKEVSDHLTSKRSYVLFVIVILIGVSMSWVFGIQMNFRSIKTDRGTAFLLVRGFNS